MDGRDTTVLDAKIFLNDLDDGSETIGGTRRVGDDREALGAGEKFFVIAAKYHIQRSLFFDRCTDNDLFDSVVKVWLHAFDGEKLAGALHDEIDILDVNIGHVLLLRESDQFAIDRNGRVIDGLHGLVPSSMNRVVFE